MDAVIERLRASKTKQVDDVIKAGFDRGRVWAEKEAGFLQLKNVAEDHISNDPDELELNSISRHVNPNSWYEFWLEIMSEQLPPPEPYFQIGFYKGAKAVWDEVKDKL